MYISTLTNHLRSGEMLMTELGERDRGLEVTKGVLAQSFSIRGSNRGVTLVAVRVH